MPSDFGISTLVLEAWDDLVEGLDILSDGAARSARDRAVKREPRTADVRTINIPGWDDVIKLGPRPRASEEEKAAHYAALRAKLPSPLNPDLAFEIERKARKGRAIASSASPAYAQAFGQVLLALDNVQDLLTTVATVGRLTLVPAVRSLEQVAASPGSRFALTARIGGKVLGRAIPLLGWTLLGADLLKLVTQVGMLAFPAYALLCGGPRAGLAAGAVAMLMGPTLCKPVGALAKINPFGRKARFARARLVRTWRPTFSNFIEVAQTTESLFGVGLSLGSVVGLVSDSAFGAEQRHRGKDVRVNVDGFADGNHRIFSGQLQREATAKLHDLRTAATVLAHGVTLHGVQDVFTVEEHMENLAATTAAFSILRPYIESEEMDRALDLALGRELAPPMYGEDVTQRDVEAAGLPWPTERRWALPGSPRTVTPERLLEYGSTAIPSALAELLMPIRDDVSSTFIGALCNQITERSAVLFTGADDAITYQDRPVYQIMTSLALSNRWPNAGDGEAKVTDFFTVAESMMTRLGSNSLVASELDSIAKIVGLQLIRGLPPDALTPDVTATNG